MPLENAPLVPRTFIVFLFAVGSVPLSAGDLAFRLHTINAESTYEASAAVDVNHDGKLDIVSGGFWYEAPSWKRHFVREVEKLGNPRSSTAIPISRWT